MLAGGGPATKKGSVGAGPLRLWPGGLCLSRAIGDFDVGDSVLCLPYISQARPGCRPGPSCLSLRDTRPKSYYLQIKTWFLPASNVCGMILGTV